MGDYNNLGKLLEARNHEWTPISRRHASMANVVLGVTASIAGSLGCKPAVDDPAKAVAIEHKACARGEMQACAALGTRYERGTGVVQDAVKAVGFYQKACDGGDMIACYNLGVFYTQGTGVVRDAVKAAALSRRRATAAT